MNSDYRVSNIYYMLTFAFNNGKIDELTNKKVDVEKFENIYDLFSIMLSLLVNKLIKKGLTKEYVLESSELGVIKGKIDITNSLRKNTLKCNRLICEYDEYSSNNYLNQIIKSTMYYLITSKKITDEYKKILKKSYFEFNDIDLIEPISIRWDKIKYNRNNITYKYVINMCYLILKGLLTNEKMGKIEFKDFIDEQSMNVLFEKFVREYFKKYFPELNPRIMQMSWNIDEGYMVEFIPKMVTDISLSYNNKLLIIDTKYYARIFNTRGFNGYDTQSLNRDNWNQINAYVANASYKNEKEVSGMLLYAKTDEDISPDIETSVMGNKIYVKTLDLTKRFTEIEKQLNDIAINFKNI